MKRYHPIAILILLLFVSLGCASTPSISSTPSNLSIISIRGRCDAVMETRLWGIPLRTQLRSEGTLGEGFHGEFSQHVMGLGKRCVFDTRTIPPRTSCTLLLGHPTPRHPSPRAEEGP